MILVENKVIIATFDSYEERSNGKLINGVIFPMGEVVDVVAPEGVVPQKYCYDATSGFYVNPNYVEYKTPEQEIEELKSQNAQILLALVQGGLM